jgi:DNA-binding transcriptional regulator YdaS (Cro superfamily)
MAEHLHEAIEKFGSKAALAKALRVTRSAVSHWVKGGELPVKRVLEIERLTGISRHKLRPDIFGDHPQRVA